MNSMRLNKRKIEIYNSKGEVLKEPYLSMAETPILNGIHTKYNPYCQDLKERFNFKRTNEGKNFWKEVYKGNSPKITNKIKCDYNHIFNDRNQKIKDYLDKCFKIDNNTNDTNDNQFNFGFGENDIPKYDTTESNNIRFSGNVLELKSIMLSIYEYIGNKNIHEIETFDLSLISPHLNIRYIYYEHGDFYEHGDLKGLSHYLTESFNIHHFMSLNLVLDIQYYKLGDDIMTTFSLQRGSQSKRNRNIIPFDRTPFTLFSKIEYKGNSYIGNIDSGFYNFKNLNKLNLKELSNTDSNLPNDTMNYTISHLDDFKISLSDRFKPYMMSRKLLHDIILIKDENSDVMNYLIIDLEYKYLFKICSRYYVGSHRIDSYGERIENTINIKSQRNKKMILSYDDKIRYLKNPKLIDEINDYLLPS